MAFSCTNFLCASNSSLLIVSALSSLSLQDEQKTEIAGTFQQPQHIEKSRLLIHTRSRIHALALVYTRVYV